MYSPFLRFLLVLAFCVSLPVWGQSASPQDAPQNGGDFSTNLHPTEKQKVPAGVILVKGAWASASDSVTALPEGGSVANNVFNDPYFGMTYPLPAAWAEKHKGPPPSDSGRYVLAMVTPTATYKGPSRGSILITAQDMFFTPLPVTNAEQLIRYTKDNLQADYQVELKPTETKVGGRPFTFFAYWSPVAELHWYVMATQIRCHTVEFVLTSRDTKLLQSLVLEMEKMKLPAEASPTGGTGGGDFPVCIKNYAREENVIERVDPVFTERRYNPVPVRIIIDKKGKVKHIHFLSAFPEQEKAISDALKQWRFKPYLRNTQPVEVETGIMFGSQPRRPATASTQAAVSE
jgi:hypothetical protein